MRRQTVAIAAVLTVFVLTGPAARSAQHKKKYEEPKTQVLPLPPELPMALAADTDALDFHISPLLKTGGLSAQIRQSLYDLIRDTRGETIIKLRAFVAGAGDARRVEDEAAAIFTERKLPLPVLSILQIGALEDDSAQVVIEAVVATRRTANPNGLAFFAGQTGASFPAALERLKESAQTASVSPEGILSCTCFTADMENPESMRAALHDAFPNTAINVVQALRVPESGSAMCEAIGQLQQPPAQGSVVWFKNARVTLVNSHQLVFTGLQLTFGNFLDDAHEAFVRLQRAASALQPVEAPVEVNAFPLDAYAGSALRKTVSAPLSVFTVQTVEGLPAIDASAGVEAVLAPNVQSPVTLAR